MRLEAWIINKSALRYLMSIYYVTHTVLDAGGVAINTKSQICGPKNISLAGGRKKITNT